MSFFRAQMTCIELPGRDGVAGSFLHFDLCQRRWCHRHNRMWTLKDLILSRSFTLPLLIEKSVPVGISGSQRRTPLPEPEENDRACVFLCGKRGAFKHESSPAPNCQCPYKITLTPLLTLRSYRTTSLLGCQMRGMWSMDLRPPIAGGPSVMRRSCRNDCWCGSPGKLRRKCSNSHLKYDKSKEMLKKKKKVQAVKALFSKGQL